MGKLGKRCEGCCWSWCMSRGMDGRRGVVMVMVMVILVTAVVGGRISRASRRSDGRMDGFARAD